MALEIKIVLFFSMLISFIISWIDLRTMTIPNLLVVMLGVLGVIFHQINDWVIVSAPEAALGAVLGAAVFFTIRYIYSRLRQSEGLGLGDVKLIFAVGIWVGVFGIPLAICVGAWTTIAAVLALKIANVSSIGPEIPFGPGLCFGNVIVVGSLLLNSG